ncbi:PEP-CTERM sorting domain-containing protein [Roseateles sp. LKC17W]|uniref:PEP-CTERM sorting domain-containing protein n=1 Tax=Pelomonas margarita TaxID=3299031 RepID=A0ABW7FET6_9BURK
MSFKPVISALLATAAWLSASPAAAVVAAPATPQVNVEMTAVEYNGLTSDTPAFISPSTTYTVATDYSTSSVTTNSTIRRVWEAPTETTAGLAYLYDVAETTTTVTDHMASYDHYSWGQQLNTPDVSGTKYVTFSATIESSAMTSVWLNVYTTGSYTPASSPFGASVPALPSFYFRMAGESSWTLLSAYGSTSAESSTFGTEASFGLKVLDGSTTHIQFAAVAGNGIALDALSVSMGQGYYNPFDQVRSVTTTTTETLVGAEVLAPVPEPETYALFAAGLLFVVMRLRNRNR